MKKFLKKFGFNIIAAVVCSAGVASLGSYADWKHIGYMGDLNGDSQITVADAVILTKHLLAENSLTSENGYNVAGKYIGINGADGFLAEKFLETADINQDGKVNVFDMILLRQHIISNSGLAVWEWEEETQTTTTTNATTITSSNITSTTTTAAGNFITAPVRDLYGSMPSQKKAEVAVFYVDFPDCKYTYAPTTAEIKNIAFGRADENNANYPFESMSAFFSRSSKGALSVDGEVYTYTTKNNKSYYENDVWHVALINEIIDAFDGSIDFSEFDGNNDGTVDAILVSVPEAAGDDDWWAAAGQFGGSSEKRADNMNIGHVIVGNAEIKAKDDYALFNSTYLHEMGHCMGLPDYYLYGVEDFQGMHGSAGFEMMDDAICDFGAASKLMLGWYTPEQVNIYDKNNGEVTYRLNDSVSENSNCVIIPNGALNSYYSEFLIVEYASLKGNNTDLKKEWWRSTGEGVRVYHVSAELSNDSWYNTFKYVNENSSYNNGRRFIRLVNDGDDYTDNLFRAGDVINSSVSGFRWYDSDGNMTVETGVEIRINDDNSITVSAK